MRPATGRRWADLLARGGDDGDYQELDEARRQSLLARALAEPAALCPADSTAVSPDARDVIGTFMMLRDALSDGYRPALGSYVISGAAAPSDVLEVLLLMKEAGLAAVGGGDVGFADRAAVRVRQITSGCRRDDGRTARAAGIPRRAAARGATGRR